MFGDPRVDEYRYAAIVEEPERRELFRRRLAQGKCPRCGRKLEREAKRCPRCKQGFR